MGATVLRVAFWVLVAVLMVVALQLALGSTGPGGAIAGLLLLAGAIAAAVRLRRSRPSTG